MIKLWRTESHSEFYEYDDQFSFNEKGKHLWLQKICFHILKKLKCNAIGEKLKVSYIEFEPNTVLDYIFNQRREILKHVDDTDCEIFCGAEYFRKLRMEDHHHTLMTFRADSASHQIFGMDVTIVPWIEGVVVVPKKRKRVN